jgi:hypothetical protein
MGIVGLLVFGSAAIRIFAQAWRHRSTVNDSLLLLMVAFAVFCSVHEIMYQRTPWLIAGALLALPGRSPEQREKNESPGAGM